MIEKIVKICAHHFVPVITNFYAIFHLQKNRKYRVRIFSLINSFSTLLKKNIQKIKILLPKKRRINKNFFITFIKINNTK